jgi:hypothetical protein
MVGERDSRYSRHLPRPSETEHHLMSTETMTRTVTTDTAEAVTAPALPADDRAGDGYDWMDTLDGTAWSVLPNWGSEGWDAGAWPYIIVAVARTRDRCSSTGPAASPTARTIFSPPPLNRPTRTGNPTPAERTKSSSGVPATTGRDIGKARQHPLTTSLRFLRILVVRSSPSNTKVRVVRLRWRRRW